MNLNEDEDKPFATGGTATGSLDAAKGAVIGKKKKPMLPPWMYLFFGGLFIVSVLAIVLPRMLRRPTAPVDTTEVVSYSEEDSSQAQMEPTVPDQPPQPEQVAQSPQPVTVHQPVMVAGTPPPPVMIQTVPPVTSADAASAVASGENMLIVEQQMQNRQDVVELQVRVAQLEGQVDRMLAAMAGQDPTMRRVISDRLRDQALSEHDRTVTVPSSRQKVNGNFKVHAVVGTRAWLRPVNSTETEIIVTYGDLVNGSRVRDVQTQSKRVVLANGTVIQ